MTLEQWAHNHQALLDLVKTIATLLALVIAVLSYFLPFNKLKSFLNWESFSPFMKKALPIIRILIMAFPVIWLENFLIIQFGFTIKTIGFTYLSYSVWIFFVNKDLPILRNIPKGIFKIANRNLNKRPSKIDEPLQDIYKINTLFPQQIKAGFNGKNGMEVVFDPNETYNSSVLFRGSNFSTQNADFNIVDDCRFANIVRFEFIPQKDGTLYIGFSLKKRTEPHEKGIGWFQLKTGTKQPEPKLPNKFDEFVIYLPLENSNPLSVYTVDIRKFFQQTFSKHSWELDEISAIRVRGYLAISRIHFMK